MLSVRADRVARASSRSAAPNRSCTRLIGAGGCRVPVVLAVLLPVIGRPCTAEHHEHRQGAQPRGRGGWPPRRRARRAPRLDGGDCMRHSGGLSAALACWKPPQARAHGGGSPDGAAACSSTSRSESRWRCCSWCVGLQHAGTAKNPGEGFQKCLKISMSMEEQQQTGAFVVFFGRDTHLSVVTDEVLNISRAFSRSYYQGVDSTREYSSTRRGALRRR